MLVLPPPSHQTQKPTTVGTGISGKPFPANTPKNNNFGTHPLQKAMKNSKQFGGSFSNAALRPEVAFLKPATLLPEDKHTWEATQTLPLWQPFSAIITHSKKPTSWLTKGLYQKALPVFAFTVTLIALGYLMVGTYTVGQKIWHDKDESFFGNSPTATALQASRVLPQEATISLKSKHPLEIADEAFRQAEAISLAAVSQPQQSASKTGQASPTKYKRADPLKPSIELVKHFSVKETPTANEKLDGFYSPPSGGNTVRPFPAVSGVGSFPAVPSLPGGGGSIRIEEELPMPTIRFVGWVKSKTEGRSVALIEVPRGGGGTVQTLAKPINTPFTIDGQTVTLRKLSNTNQLEASVGSNKKILGLEVSGGELKQEDPEKPQPEKPTVPAPSTEVKVKNKPDAKEKEALSNEELLNLLIRQLN